jgi:hypothetical protein
VWGSDVAWTDQRDNHRYGSPDPGAVELQPPTITQRIQQRPPRTITLTRTKSRLPTWTATRSRLNSWTAAIGYHWSITATGRPPSAARRRSATSGSR